MPKKAYSKAVCRLCGKKRSTNGALDLPNRQIICKKCQETHKIKLFRIGCYWEVCSHYEIHATNLEDAIEIAESGETPFPDSDPDYVPDSFKVDPTCCEEVDPEEEEESCPNCNGQGRDTCPLCSGTNKPFPEEE